MKIKTSELTGAALDWAVAKCENSDTSIEHFVAMHSHYAYDHGTFDYSTKWAQGGPIIESNEIELKSIEEGVWQASNLFDDMEWHHFVGYSPLIAAMRCHVAHRLGEEVEIPKELYED